MAFFINDELGVAYESTEGGLAKWNSEDEDFSDLMSSEEIDALTSPSQKRVSEREAFSFMRSKSSGEGASSPRE